jgi:hypothetical protein
MKNNLNILLFVFLLPVYSLACTCNGINEVNDEVKVVDAVIIASVISKEYIHIVDSTLSTYNKNISLYKYTFVVHEKFKGRISKDTISIFTGPSAASCGINFKIGEKYIVYGFKKSYFRKEKRKISPKGENIFWTHKCTRTRPFSKEESIKIRELL